MARSLMLQGLKRLAVIQPLPGIGDTIWHLPHIHAIAAHAGVPVTVITKPRSAADQLLGGDPAIADVLWVDRNPENRVGRHDGPLGQLRLIGDLRARAFDAVVLLHHSHSLAFVIWAAGIRQRHGYGYGMQRWFLNRPPFLPASALPLHPFEQATAYLRAAGIAMPEAEPKLVVDATARTAMQRRMAGRPGPFIAIGIGSSEPYKQWGAERFAGLAGALLDAGWQSLVLLGGPAEAALAEDIRSRLGERAPMALPAIGWSLGELAALLAASAFYVGNDTGMMNLAAAAGARTYGLFGGTAPFRHASQIVPILPPGQRADRDGGMARITVASVLRAVREDRGALAPCLGACE